VERENFVENYVKSEKGAEVPKLRKGKGQKKRISDFSFKLKTKPGLKFT